MPKGTCVECKDYQRTIPDYCCLLCALGITKKSDEVIKDPITGTIHIDLSDPNHPFWGRKIKNETC